MNTLFLNEHVQLNKWFKLNKTSEKTLLNDIFEKRSYRFFNFCVGTLFLNEHVQLKKLFKLNKTSVKTLLNDIFEKRSY